MTFVSHKEDVAPQRFSYLLDQQHAASSNSKASSDSLWQKCTNNNRSFSIHYKPTVHTGI